MDEINSIFSSIMFCYFLDNGPSSIDFFSLGEIVESPDLTAVRLMTKSTALVRGDDSQQVEQSIVDQLSGPDIFPVDTNYRMIWYNWLISNRFSKDPRITDRGAMAGIYCIYNKKQEKTVRGSLEIIENLLRNTSFRLKSVEDVIREKLHFFDSVVITEIHYSKFLEEKYSDIITKKIHSFLNEEVKKYSKKYGNHQISQTRTFKIILQSMIFNKGRPNEITEKSEKRKHWNVLIRKLDQIIVRRIPNLNKKKIEITDLKEFYRLLAEEQIWVVLKINGLSPLVQNKDVADFFFYYWLAYKQLLKKKFYIQLFIDITAKSTISD